MRLRSEVCDGRREATVVQRIRRHRKFAVVLLPGVTGTISVHLDSEPIGIPQVQGFTDQVIGHSWSYVRGCQVRGKPPEGAAPR